MTADDCVVVCYPVDEDCLRKLREAVGEAELLVTDQQRVARDVKRATVFGGHARVPVDWEAVVAAGRLRWIHSTAAGLDHCLVPAVIESPIIVTGSSGLFADQVAEQALALVLGLMRRLPAFLHAQLQRRFERLECDDLRVKGVAVLGCGGNGERIAQLLAPACRKLVATDLWPDAIDGPHPFEVVSADLTEEVIAASDVVICALPLTTATRGWLDRRRLGLIRRGGYLVNVGRGPIVDELALIDLLREGHLTGAGLDVFAIEPLPTDSPLWNMPQVIITPHVGAQSTTRYRDVTLLFTENVRRMGAGKPLINLVDREAGFPRPETRLRAGWRAASWAQWPPEAP